MLFSLEPGRGSCLWRAPAGGLTIEFLAGDFTRITGIAGNHYFAAWPYKLYAVPENQPCMVINSAQTPASFLLSPYVPPQNVLWDPYAFERAQPPEINPDAFQAQEAPIPVPTGYVDTLAKWYSVKYSYRDFNLIFIRPHLGISFQIHAQRGEHWEILAGTPIVITGASVTFDARPGDQFDLPLGAMHGIINPGKDTWVALKETWSGHFSEQDITRVFNPNNYIDPKPKTL